MLEVIVAIHVGVVWAFLWSTVDFPHAVCFFSYHCIDFRMLRNEVFLFKTVTFSIAV
jgi:hypothetical protein